jgi:DNA-binding transcriptional LysR family regulator
MREQNLTRAGRRLGMSQPPMSHSIARLRHTSDSLSRFISTKVPLHSLASILIGWNAGWSCRTASQRDLAAHFPLIVRSLPFSAPRLTLSMIWHRRLDNHPAHCCLCRRDAADQALVDHSRNHRE